MVITNLQPETAYSITVAAYTMKGDGARSKPKVVVTKGAGTRPPVPCPWSPFPWRPRRVPEPLCGEGVSEQGGAGGSPAGSNPVVLTRLPSDVARARGGQTAADCTHLALCPLLALSRQALCPEPLLQAAASAPSVRPLPCLRLLTESFPARIPVSILCSLWAPPPAFCPTPSWLRPPLVACHFGAVCPSPYLYREAFLGSPASVPPSGPSHQSQGSVCSPATAELSEVGGSHGPEERVPGGGGRAQRARGAAERPPSHLTHPFFLRGPSVPHL